MPCEIVMPNNTARTVYILQQNKMAGRIVSWLGGGEGSLWGGGKSIHVYNHNMQVCYSMVQERH